MSANSITVSVILPMYNSEKFVSETIESILNQNYKDFELIIVDDCSKDKSIKIAKEYANKDSRVKVYQLTKNSGSPAAPRNYAIKKAKGKYLAFVDSDDIWSPDKLSIQMGYVLSNNYDFITSDAYIIDENSNLIQEKIFKKYLKLIFSFLKKENYSDICFLVKKRFIYTSSVLIKKEIMLNFNENKYYVEDLCAWLEVFIRYKPNVKFIQKKLIKYRYLSSGSVSNREHIYLQDSQAIACISYLIQKYKLPKLYNCLLKANLYNFIRGIIKL